MVLHFRRRQLPAGLGWRQIFARPATPDHDPISLRTLARCSGWIVGAWRRRRSNRLPAIIRPPEWSSARSATEPALDSFFGQKLPRGLPFGWIENFIAILIELLYQLEFGPRSASWWPAWRRSEWLLGDESDGREREQKRRGKQFKREAHWVRRKWRG